MATYAIWKDIIYSTFIVGEYLPYTVTLDGIEIFAGRAYRDAETKNFNIPIAEIARPYITGDATLSDTSIMAQSAWGREVKIIDTRGRTLATYYFFADWSYGEEAIPQGASVISRPIQRVIDPRQYVVVSVGTTDITFAYNIVAEGEDTEILYSTSANSAPAETFWQKADLGNAREVRVEIDDMREVYAVKKTSATHVLYYLNAIGGWDSLLVTGNVTRDNSYQREEIRRRVSNTSKAHGNVVISTEFEVEWKLNTDYLTDDEWSRMHHLIGSPRVYLHDLATDTLTPVNIQDRKVTFKTYRNQGRKMSFAEITVKASQPRMRR